ncbi:cupin domain-containing protein [Microcoleus sp. AR_TQ3_B6]|uniref:cupin domain-containing protein n=1 Tax=Microcoleus sp. AR_TQ3_B6 TaxID=3055284 RepID=UPI002FD15EAF
MKSSFFIRFNALSKFLILVLLSVATTPGMAVSCKLVSTILIEKKLPYGIKTIKAPDTDQRHYTTLAGTHFSYRCNIPYTLKTKEAAIKICEIDPVELKILSWPETEVINIIKGEVEIEEANGIKKTYVAGDMFVLPQGFKGVWRQSEMLIKVVVRHPLYWKD